MRRRSRRWRRRGTRRLAGNALKRAPTSFIRASQGVFLQGACKVEDGTSLTDWRGRVEWPRLHRIVDDASLAGGLFHVRGAVSGQAVAIPAGCVAGAGCGGPGVADPFPDYVFYWSDSGAAERLRVAEVWGFGLGGHGGGDLDDAGAWSADYGDRGDRAIGVGVCGGNRHDEGDRRD